MGHLWRSLYPLARQTRRVVAGARTPIAWGVDTYCRRSGLITTRLADRPRCRVVGAARRYARSHGKVTFPAATSRRERRYHRGWRAPLPRRKSTNPPTNSCDRRATFPLWNCSRNRAEPTKYLPLSLGNRPTLMAVMALIPSRLGRADCPSEIAVIEPPI